MNCENLLLFQHQLFRSYPQIDCFLLENVVVMVPIHLFGSK